MRQDGGVTAPRAGRDRPGWPMAAHQLASAYKKTVGWRAARRLSVRSGKVETLAEQGMGEEITCDELTGT